MVGIERFGAYVPYFRLGKSTEAWRGRGERAVAGFDEDSITMAVAAALDCLQDRETGDIDALYFASTTSPYKEKQAATLVAKAIDLREDIFTIDFAGSTRAGTAALKAAADSVRSGTAERVLVVMADMRVPRPRSELDDAYGDGAAAFLIGSEGVVAEIEDTRSFSHEIYDVWRTEGGKFPRSAEDRFVLQEGYLKAMKQVVTSVLESNDWQPQDVSTLVAYGPSQRRQAEIGRALGFDAAQLAPGFFGELGDAGCAFVPVMLVAALEEATADQRILVVSYGQGADAIALRTNSGIANVAKGRGVKGHLASKKVLPSYLDYLRWRGLVDLAHAANRPPPKIPAVHALYREAKRNITLYGVKCRACGTVQYPDERVCTECQTKDEMDPYKLSKRGTLFTYAMDYLGPTLDPPLVVAVVDFEGGGRGLFSMTDRDIDDIHVGMPIEMSLRRLHTVEDIINYSWCVVPLRA
jgi:3-hydroxy-3-methylglutaryl CoA synthase